MSTIEAVLETLNADLGEASSQFGRRVDAVAGGLTSRAGELTLDPPSDVSPNRACRLFSARDGWMALNLAREDDVSLLPAWLDYDLGEEPWTTVTSGARLHDRSALVERAALLGLPAAAVSEVDPDLAPCQRQILGERRDRTRAGLVVLDLSALWAGPLCGAALAAAGASVVRVESLRRPDPSRSWTPRFFERLNRGKSELGLDFTTDEGREALGRLFLEADVVITSARPRAFEQLGLEPAGVFTRNPGLTWVALTAYGWSGPGARRVGFGDDTAAAGGLLRWTADGAPRFLGDALGDPVTGLMAGAAALRCVMEGGGVLLDVAMARCAAKAAAMSGAVLSP